jgi:hypothetical protein
MGVSTRREEAEVARLREEREESPRREDREWEEARMKVEVEIEEACRKEELHGYHQVEREKREEARRK